MNPLFLAAEYTPPDGMNEMMARIMYIAIFIAAVAIAYRVIFPAKEKRPVPQPLVVKTETLYADKEQTDKRIEEVERQIQGVEQHFDEKFEQARMETDKKLDEMSDDAIQGRRRLHDEVREVRKEMGDIPEKTINMLIKTKGLL